jgi:hypothetical protein
VLGEFVFVIVRIGAIGITGVISLTIAVLVAPPPVAVATLVTNGTAVLPTDTSKVMGGAVPPGGMTASVVVVIVCPDTMGSVQPDPDKLPETKVNPLGNTSVTVIVVPFVGVLLRPLLPTITVYVPV